TKDKLLKADQDYIKILRRVILQAMDMYWVEHLEVMDYMRSSVNLRAYGQRDPLIEYKREGLALFKSMQMSINAQIVGVLPNLGGMAAAVAKPLNTIESDARGILGQESAASSSADKKGRNEKVIVVKDGIEKEVKW